MWQSQQSLREKMSLGWEIPRQSYPPYQTPICRTSTSVPIYHSYTLINSCKEKPTSDLFDGMGLYSKQSPFFPFSLLNFHFRYSSEVSDLVLDFADTTSKETITSEHHSNTIDTSQHGSVTVYTLVQTHAV